MFKSWMLHLRIVVWICLRRQIYHYRMATCCDTFGIFFVLYNWNVTFNNMKMLPLNVTLLKGMHLINNMIINTCSISTCSRMNWNTKNSTKLRWKMLSWWFENIYGLQSSLLLPTQVGNGHLVKFFQHLLNVIDIKHNGRDW
jgi:hypothetical protein